MCWQEGGSCSLEGTGSQRGVFVESRDCGPGADEETASGALPTEVGATPGDLLRWEWPTRGFLSREWKVMELLLEMTLYFKVKGEHLQNK